MLDLQKIANILHLFLETLLALKVEKVQECSDEISMEIKVMALELIFRQILNGVKPIKMHQEIK